MYDEDADMLDRSDADDDGDTDGGNCGSGCHGGGVVAHMEGTCLISVRIRIVPPRGCCPVSLPLLLACNTECSGKIRADSIPYNTPLG